MNQALSLAEGLQWLQRMPAAFLAVPQGTGGAAAASETVYVRAVVADLFLALYGMRPTPLWLAAFDRNSSAADSDKLFLQAVLAACHLLWHPQLRLAPPGRAALERMLGEELRGWAGVATGAPTADQERSEELLRRVLRAAGRPLRGESEQEGQDRLQQVDLVERARLIAAATERQQARAREVREALARKAAEEAAAKVTRE